MVGRDKEPKRGRESGTCRAISVAQTSETCGRARVLRSRMEATTKPAGPYGQSRQVVSRG